MRKFLVLLFVVLCGCQSLSYQEPVDGPRARVRFVTETKNVTVLRMYNDSNCVKGETEWLRLREGFFLRRTPKQLGMPLWKYHTNAAKEVYVEANKMLYGLVEGSETVDHWGSFKNQPESLSRLSKITKGSVGFPGLRESTIYRCATPFQFSFLDGEDYEVVFKWDRFNCTTVISHLINDETGLRFVDVAKFDNRLAEHNSGCRSAFTAFRWY